MKNEKKGTRDGFLMVPVSNGEKTIIKKTADELGVTMSCLTRMVLLDFCKRQEEEQKHD